MNAVNAILKEGKNVKIVAVAGAGKTTFILHLAQNLSFGKKILLLTFNSALKLETRERVKKLRLWNKIEAHSFHSFAFKYYSERCARDICSVNYQDISLKQNTPRYDIIAIDECQDVSPSIFSFLAKMFCDLNRLHNYQKNHSLPPPLQLVIIGDPNQSVYAFKGRDADNRYLLYCDEIYNQDVLPYIAKDWWEGTFSKSFRITQSMANFLNLACLQPTDVKTESHKQSSPCKPVNYFTGDPFVIGEEIAKEIVNQIRNGEYKAEDYFILAPSVKLGINSPLSKLVNELSMKNIQIYSHSGEEGAISEEIIKGKLVVSSLNAAKGMERKVVIVFSFNYQYFQFYAKDPEETPRNLLPSVFYVALTRGKELLYIIGESKKNDHMPFLNRNLLDEAATKKDPWIVFRNFSSSSSSSSSSFTIEVAEDNNITDDKIKGLKEDNPLPVSVTSLISHLDPQYEKELMKKIEQVTVRQRKSKLVRLDDVTDHELVADLNGNAVVGLIQWKEEKKLTMLENMIEVLLDNEEDIATMLVSELNGFPSFTFNVKKKIPFLKEKVENLKSRVEAGGSGNGDVIDMPLLLEVANVFNAMSLGMIHRVNQIKSYKWLNEQVAMECVDNLTQMIPPLVTSEKGVKDGYQCVHLFEHFINMTFKWTSKVNSRYWKWITLEGILDMIAIEFFENDVEIPKITCFEMKVVKSLETVHLLQLAVYAYLLLETNSCQNLLKEKLKKSNCDGYRLRYLLQNGIDGECIEIFVDLPAASELIETLFEYKYGERKNSKLEDFISNAQRICKGLL